jgi:hypothetical protein
MIDLAEVSGLGDAFHRARAGLPPGLPSAFADMLAAALALETRESTGRAESLRLQYLDVMPRLRREQLDPARQPEAALFHTPLDWSRLPRLSDALERWRALCAGAGITIDVAALRAHRTLADLYATTFYGACMPLLYAYPGDVAYFARGLSRGDDPLAVIDRHLAVPLLHELAHGRADRPAIFPLHLDECLAGWLGIRALPSFAYPAEGAEDSIYAAPWFAQVGQALARAFGLAPLLRAHLGHADFRDVLPEPLVAALGRLGWSDYVAARRPHFLSDNMRPERWMKIFFLAAAGRPLEQLDFAVLDALPWTEVPPGEESPEDVHILADALRAMCLDNARDADHFVVRPAAPRGPITIDLDACAVSAPAGPIDPAPPRYLFPPASAARLRRSGPARFTVTLAGAHEADSAAAAILQKG